jgi:hypothetical protein
LAAPELLLLVVLSDPQAAIASAAAISATGASTLQLLHRGTMRRLLLTGSVDGSDDGASHRAAGNPDGLVPNRTRQISIWKYASCQARPETNPARLQRAVGPGLGRGAPFSSNIRGSFSGAFAA